jgi:hypothetical protein
MYSTQQKVYINLLCPIKDNILQIVIIFWKWNLYNVPNFVLYIMVVQLDFQNQIAIWR